MLISYCGSGFTHIIGGDSGQPRQFFRGEVVEMDDDAAIDLLAQNRAFRWTGFSASSFDVREVLRGLDLARTVTSVKPLLMVGITAGPRPDGTFPVLSLLDQLRAQTAVTLRAVIAFASVTSEVIDRIEQLNGPTARGRWIDVLPPLDMPVSQEALSANHNRLISQLLQYRQPYFLTLQDDVRLAPEAMRRVVETGKVMVALDKYEHRVGLCSFYTTDPLAGKCPRALWPYPMHVFCGELALLWLPDAAAAFLANHDPVAPHDRAIGAFFAESVWECYSHSPCLVDHLGIPSTVGNNTAHMVSPNFTGSPALATSKPW